ncbi:MAG: transposase family protein [Methylocella sp.]
MVRTLWDALGEIEDRRGRQGRHYELRSILGIAVGAMLAGSNDLLSIFRWGRRLKPEALKLFGIARGWAPKLCRALWVVSLGVRRRPNISPSSFDKLRMRGKTLRGSRRLDDRPLHVLSAFATALSAVIGDLAVAQEANEITAAMALLKGLPLDGAIITGDAIFAQAARYVATSAPPGALPLRGQRQPAGIGKQHQSRLRRPFPPVTGRRRRILRAQRASRRAGRVETRQIAVTCKAVKHL